MMARIHKITVDLIIHDDHLMTQADVSHALQLVLCPYASHRIVRIAEQKYLHVVFHNFPLKILKIHCVAAIFVMQLIVDENSSVILNNFPERIIYRLLDEDRIALLCKCLYAGGKAVYHAAAHCHRFPIYMVAMTREEPVIQRIKVFPVRIRVAKNPMIDPRPEVRKDLLRKLKIHICHPQR